MRQYKFYKLAAGKTAKSILISCGARLAPFDIQELRDLTMYDELQLDTLGDKKTVLFLIMSDTDSTFNFLISMPTMMFPGRGAPSIGRKSPTTTLSCLLVVCCKPIWMLCPRANGTF